eukprot:s1666_g7.t1
MSKTSLAARRAASLDTRLRQQLSQRCQLVKQSAGSQARDWAQAKNMKRLRRRGFVEQPCRLLGLCVCTEYPDVVHMYRNVAAYFRGIFVKKKKIPSPARVLLEKREIFIKFRFQTKSASADRPSVGEDVAWLRLLQQ